MLPTSRKVRSQKILSLSFCLGYWTILKCRAFECTQFSDLVVFHLLPTLSHMISACLTAYITYITPGLGFSLSFYITLISLSSIFYLSETLLKTLRWWDVGRDNICDKNLGWGYSSRRGYLASMCEVTVETLALIDILNIIIFIMLAYLLDQWLKLKGKQHTCQIAGSLILCVPSTLQFMRVLY